MRIGVGILAGTLVPALLGAEAFTHRLDAVRQLTFKPAKAAYLALVPEIRASGDKAALSRVCLELARLHQAVNEDTQALALLSEGARAARDAKIPKDEAKHEQLIGLIAFQRGDFETSFQAFDRALGLFDKLKDYENAASVELRMAQIHFEDGRYLEALRACQSARGRAQHASGNAWAEESSRHARVVEAALYKQLGKPEKAIEILQEVQAEPGKIKPRQQAEITLQLGELHRRMGEPEKAAELLLRASNQFERLHGYEQQLSALLELGSTQAAQLNKFEQAGPTFERAQRIADFSGKRREQVYSRLARGEAYYLDGYDDEAENYWRQAQWVARDAGAIDGAWRALHGLGRIAERRAELNTALRLYQQAVDLLESPRARLEPPIGGPPFLPKRREAYDSLIGLLLASRDDDSVNDRVLDLMERQHAAANAEWLLASRRPETRALRAQLRMLSASRLRVRFQEGKQTDLELDRIAAEYARVQPEFGGSPVVTIENLQSKLLSDAAIVIYWMAQSQLGYLWITEDASGRRVRSLSDDDRARIQQMLYEASRPNSVNLQRLATEVGALLADFDLPARVRKLILVPDSALSGLPWELLAVKGKPLLDSYQISYLPSAAAFLRPSRSRRSGFPWTTQAMLIAGPAGFVSPGAWNLLPQDEEWMRKAYTAAELNTIPTLLAGRSEVLMGAQARVSSWRDPRRIPLLHVATQAVADRESPWRSRLLVASEGGQAGLEYVYLPDLRQMDLAHIDLATLPVAAGDQARSFGDALIAAGARAAVTPLWHVDEKPAGEFMAAFYSNLGQGMSKAAALSAAKRAMKANPAYTHPAYWAGFVLTGDGFDPLPRVYSWAAMMTMAAGCFVLGGLALSWLRPKRQRHS